MNVAFLMDVHVPRAITFALRLQGIDVLTAQDDGSAELDDATLLRCGPPSSTGFWFLKMKTCCEKAPSYSRLVVSSPV